MEVAEAVAKGQGIEWRVVAHRRLWKGLEYLGHKFEKRVFPFEELLLAICRGDFDHEPCTVLAANPFST